MARRTCACDTPRSSLSIWIVQHHETESRRRRRRIGTECGRRRRMQPERGAARHEGQGGDTRSMRILSCHAVPTGQLSHHRATRQSPAAAGGNDNDSPMPLHRVGSEHSERDADGAIRPFGFRQFIARGAPTDSYRLAPEHLCDPREGSWQPDWPTRPCDKGARSVRPRNFGECGDLEIESLRGESHYHHAVGKVALPASGVNRNHNLQAAFRWHPPASRPTALATRQPSCRTRPPDRARSTCRTSG